MRTTQVFVLRLWVDTDEPYQLRGALHSIADDANCPFADAQALLDLLRQMTRGVRTPMQLGNQNREGGNGERDD